MIAPKEIYITTDFARFTNLDKPVPNRECVKYIRADLAELTWEDMKKIGDLWMEVATIFAMFGMNKTILEQPFYEAVANSFNEQRKK